MGLNEFSKCLLIGGLTHVPLALPDGDLNRGSDSVSGGSFLSRKCIFIVECAAFAEQVIPGQPPVAVPIYPGETMGPLTKREGRRFLFSRAPLQLSKNDDRWRQAFESPRS